MRRHNRQIWCHSAAANSAKARSAESAICELLRVEGDLQVMTLRDS
jgi:hypothetical protein